MNNRLSRPSRTSIQRVVQAFCFLGAITGCSSSDGEQGVNDGGVDGSTDSNCVPKTCGDKSATCGAVSDGCGKILECGSCGPTERCGVSGADENKCVPACTPKTCIDIGADCGLAGDGCGGTLTCGTCGTGLTCGGGGTANRCAKGTCTASTCLSLGKNCGAVGDGCGLILPCGTCATGEACGVVTANVCGATCTPTTCAALGAECGTVPDGCTGTLTCPACPAGKTCGIGGANVCGVVVPDAGVDSSSDIGSDSGSDTGTGTDTGGDTGPTLGCKTASDCRDAPVELTPASCPAGTTFMASFGGDCGATCNVATGVCSYKKVAVACPATGAAVLPTYYAWQAKLREYMASLTAADFTPAAGSKLAYGPTQPGYSAAAKDQLGWWLMGRALAGSGSNFPYSGFPDTYNILPSEFTLAQIEQIPAHAKVGWKGGTPTDYAAWLTQSDLPGNGFLNSKPEFLRAFAFTSADLMLTAKRYVQDKAADTWLWSALPYHGYVGLVAHKGNYLKSTPLEQCGLAAYDAGMRAMLNRAAAVAVGWKNDGNGDMVAMGLRGFVYLAQALGDKAADDTGHKGAVDLTNNNASPNGYWNHFSCVNCYDASYEGTTYTAVREAAIMSGWPELKENARALLHTMSYLTLPEPGGQWYGPSHFSPATADPSAYVFPPSVSSLPNIEFGEAYFTLFRDAGGATMTWPTPAEVKTNLTSWIGNLSPTPTKNFDDPKNNWAADDHYSYGMPNGTFYKSAWYDTLQTLIATPTDPRRFPPFSRAANFIEPLGEDFLIAKLGTSGVVIHTGNVDNRASTAYGFGGGALSAFWSAGTGSALLGWSRGGQNQIGSVPSPNSWSGTKPWDGWRAWSTHAVTGMVGTKPFSSARLTSVTRSHTTTASSAIVNVSGDLNSGTANPQKALTAALPYTRLFEVGTAAAVDGVRITTSLKSLPAGVTELYEILPVWDHAYNQRPTGSPAADCVGEGTSVAVSMVTVDFYQGAILVKPVTGTAVNNVTSIQITRFGKKATIKFDAPQTVAIGPQLCTDYQQWGPVGRNLFISLPRTPGDVSIRYTITPN